MSLLSRSQPSHHPIEAEAQAMPRQGDSVKFLGTCIEPKPLKKARPGAGREPGKDSSFFCGGVALRRDALPPLRLSRRGGARGGAEARGGRRGRGRGRGGRGRGGRIPTARDVTIPRRPANWFVLSPRPATGLKLARASQSGQKGLLVRCLAGVLVTRSFRGLQRAGIRSACT